MAARFCYAGGNGLPVQLALTAGEAHDNRLAGKLLSRWKSGTMLLADRAYDGDWIRVLVAKKGVWANIPPKCNRNSCFSPHLYRTRNLIERFLKRAAPRQPEMSEKERGRRRPLPTPAQAGHNDADAAPLGCHPPINKEQHRAGRKCQREREDAADPSPRGNSYLRTLFIRAARVILLRRREVVGCSVPGFPGTCAFQATPGHQTSAPSIPATLISDFSRLSCSCSIANDSDTRPSLSM
jgi:transposase